ncbi:phage adaptor protein [Arthrobacter cavernae]|uniref:Uncharacterized protein n=1 Tax=Arthrobacter cavernae TaxID=2817681 RepID=A0A939KIX3_9MICC|nr:hypothetical protein [Arthrobacter cavernae]MBO1267089.1 hypothetical protein [Arthrobacter cavernae]
MAYDTASLVTEIKLLGKDQNIADSLVIGWIQETQDRVMGRHRFPQLESVTITPMIIGDSTSFLPSDLQTVDLLTLSDLEQTTVPEYMAFRDFEERFRALPVQSQGRPNWYTIYARSVRFERPVDKAYNIGLKYLRRPTELTSGVVVPDIPQEYKKLLVHGGLAGLEAYRGNFDVEAIHLRRVEELEEDMLLRYVTRQTTRTSKVRSTAKITKARSPNQGYSL